MKNLEIVLKNLAEQKIFCKASVQECSLSINYDGNSRVAQTTMWLSLVEKGQKFSQDQCLLIREYLTMLSNSICAVWARPGCCLVGDGSIRICPEHAVWLMRDSLGCQNDI